MMRSPVNFRAFAVTALALTATGFCIYAYMFMKPLGIALFCVFIAAISCYAGYTVYKFINNKTKLRVPIAFFAAVVMCVCSFAIGVTAIDERAGVSSGNYTVSGRICASNIATGVYKVDLENLSFSGKRMNGILRLEFAPDDNNIAEHLDCGDILTFDAYVKVNKLYSKGSVNAFSYRTDIRYTVKTSADTVFSVKYGNPDLGERFFKAFHKLYTDNMGEKYGNIAFSMITGDKFALDSDISDYMSAAGLGHILAVSGLHIGFVTLFLNLILFKVPIRIRYPIIGALLLVYGALAGFSPSVVRALIMAYVSGASVLLFARRDLLSSLLCAYSIILAFKPIYMFESGFLLSFGSIFGIAMFADGMSRALESKGVAHRLSNAISGSAAVNLGCFPAQTFYFGHYNLLSLVANTVLLPYITVLFIALLCCSVIAAIPGCGALLKLCMWGLMPLDYIAYGLASVSFVNISFKASAAAFVCYPIMFCASEFFMVAKGKRILIIFSIIICAAIFIVGSL